MLENNNFDEVVMKRHTAREFDPEITISKGELLQIRNQSAECLEHAANPVRGRPK